MKFRTDFVTNSSDSSFLTFNIKNKKLYDALTKLGLKFQKVDEGEFSDRMAVELPSGKTMCIDTANSWDLPSVTDASSISAWLVSTILWGGEPSFWDDEEDEDDEGEDDDDEDEDDDYSRFTKELVQLLNQADITHLDLDAAERSSAMYDALSDLDRAFGPMDEDLAEATVEETYGFEGEVSTEYISVKDGKRMRFSYSNDDEVETEDCEGLKFVVTGKLKFFENREEIVALIEDAGGHVVDSVSKNTDYLICNDLHSTSSKMKKAKELGITVLSEAAFIRRFADPEEFEGLTSEEDLYDEAWSLTYEGGSFDFVVGQGMRPLLMEVWKDGKWVRPAD